MTKKKVGLFLEETLADKLDAVVEKLGVQKGIVVGAAVRMFLESDNDAKRQALERESTEWIARAFGDEPAATGKRLTAKSHTSLNEYGKGKAKPESSRDAASPQAARQPEHKP
jgi:metal-responsive CopG/Arc/MetJ family transcriptional regulator